MLLWRPVTAFTLRGNAVFLQQFENKRCPDCVWRPNGVQVLFGLGNRDVLINDAIQKAERRSPKIHLSMNQRSSARLFLQRACKQVEIVFCRGTPVDRNIDVVHAKFLDDTVFILKRRVVITERQVNDTLETFPPDVLQLLLVRLART